MVERRDVRQNQWIVISSFCKNTTFTVQGLTEGQEYLFRILAANVNGTGPPLDGVNPIRAKAPYDVPGEVITSGYIFHLSVTDHCICTYRHETLGQAAATTWVRCLEFPLLALAAGKVQ